MKAVEQVKVTDSVTYELIKQDPSDRAVLRSNVHVELIGPDGVVKQQFHVKNLVTDHGDEMMAARIYDDAQNIVTGMRLGTGSTAASKNGAGAAIVTYISGSQELLDAAATDATKGAGSGWRTTYICTWEAGDITNAAIAEVVLTDETALTDVAGTEANTVARFVFPATIDKQSDDLLRVTWNVDHLGA